MSLADSIALHEPVIRLAAFVLVLIAMAAWELAAPRRALTITRRKRWTTNLGLALLNTLLLRLLMPIAGVGAAEMAADNGWGYFNDIDVPVIVALFGSLIALDFITYLQHVLFHAVPVLWRLHRVHHADLDFDVTTAIRFHPIEMLLSLLVKLATIMALGVPAGAVVLFEVILNAASMFSHGNVRMPVRLERIVRWLVVTPDMHRVHHSVRRPETDSNFDFNLSIWDRLLGTYRAQPVDGHDAMTIGVLNFRDAAHCATLSGALALPFRGALRRGPTGVDAPHETY
jgi:sterol desaturase/sphingolipid hydroxylase (fatty acid hydroxylase superfamily)